MHAFLNLYVFFLGFMYSTEGYVQVSFACFVSVILLSAHYVMRLMLKEIRK